MKFSLHNTGLHFAVVHNLNSGKVNILIYGFLKGSTSNAFIDGISINYGIYVYFKNQRQNAHHIKPVPPNPYVKNQKYKNSIKYLFNSIILNEHLIATKKNIKL